MNCKILLIDTPSDIKLIQESITHMTMPIDIQPVTSITAAMEAIHTGTPDIILIGSSRLMEDFKILVKVKEIPVVILCESNGFEVLLQNNLNNVLCITRPFDTDDIPEVFKKVFEFWALQRKRVHNVQPED
ncbi:MAG: hypothetical protein ACM3MI_09720 [Clostridiales bacterium]